MNPFYLLTLFLNSVLSSAINVNYTFSTSPTVFQQQNESSGQLLLRNNQTQHETDAYQHKWTVKGAELDRYRYKRYTTTTYLGDTEFFSNHPDFLTQTPPPIYHVEFSTAYVSGMRIEGAEKGVTYDYYGVLKILANVPMTIRFFGSQFTNHTMVRFSTEFRTRGDVCLDASETNVFPIAKISLNSVSALVHASLAASRPNELYYICVRENDTEMPWVHQGPDAWLMIKAQERLLPFWVQTILICVLLMFSGLFAGLTLGLLSLDKTSLKILANTGDHDEHLYAKTILPLRSRGNYLLCSLVLGNVLVNSSLTIILDDLTTGLVAVTVSTAGIVIFGEIIPQAVCSRNGLAIGAKTIYITKFFMIITFPLAYPLSMILDKVLGEEIGSVYNRERLKELLKVTKDHHGLEKEEVGIISGALDMKTKTVKDIMVPLDNVFMLPVDTVLDFNTMTEVEYHGYSRIPIFEQQRSNVVALLNVKQLTLLDANDNIPLKNVIEYSQNKVFSTFENTRLDYMFRTFREGSRGHMAFVQRINDEGPGDPLYETIGLVTMEDVLEELLQAEIMDESDIGKQEARLANSVRHKNSTMSFDFNQMETEDSG